MMLERLPAQAEFESLKSAVRYGTDSSAFMPTKLREMIRAASARQAEFRGRNGGGQRGGQRGGQKSSGNKVGEKGKSENQQQHAEHLKVDCPERAKKQRGADGGEHEQKRKPRGKVTIRRTKGSPSPGTSDEDIGVLIWETGALEITDGDQPEDTAGDHEGDGVQEYVGDNGDEATMDTRVF
ncbi:hypothetical protein PC121_g20515 [Phytophthora cactorum]|nr:hypothetical protein PC120_g20823 [Phytophthora cactorum]KAG3046709.1 hypothetical protein PC121_g20515 [Phytophthora cactorum]